MAAVGYVLLVVGVLFNALALLSNRRSQRGRSALPPALLRLGPLLLLAGFALLVFGDRD